MAQALLKNRREAVAVFFVIWQEQRVEEKER